jgi:hypothetical protein
MFPTLSMWVVGPTQPAIEWVKLPGRLVLRPGMSAAPRLPLRMCVQLHSVMFDEARCFIIIIIIIIIIIRLFGWRVNDYYCFCYYYYYYYFYYWVPR